MDRYSSTKPKDSNTPTVSPSKTSEKQSKAEDSALDSHVQLTTRQKTKLGLPLEKKIELEQRRRHVLINEYNRLKFAVKEKEAKLKEVQESLKVNDLQPINYNNEDTCKQRIRQLENDIDKIKVKITGAREIQTAYRHIHEHLQQEVRGTFTVLDQKETAVTIGQAEVDKETKHFQSAAAAADSALGSMVQMEQETMGKKRQMEIELFELSSEEKELKRQMETLGKLSLRLKEQDIEEEAHSLPVTDHQRYDVCGASPSDLQLVEDMEALREALGCAEVQDLVNKVVSQRATEEELLAELTQYGELTRQEAQTLDDLELQYAGLKFSEKPAATSFDQLQEELQAKLSEQMCCVERLKADLKQSQDLFDTVEQGIKNIYFRISCIPVEELTAASSADGIDKLKDISARLPTLLQRASEQEAELSGLDQERVYGALEQLNRMESRNVKRPTTPIDAPQLSDDEEECSPTREEIKRSSIRLIESQQSKKKK